MSPARDLVVGGSRRWWWAGVAVLVVVLAVVAVQIIRQATAGPPPPPAGCDAPVAPSTDLPGGAVAVVLCDAAESHNLPAGAPPDALIEGVESVIKTYRGLPPADESLCTQDSGHRYQLVFTYRGRDPVRITGEPYACWTVGGRKGADVMLTSFRDQLRIQRARQGPWSGQVPDRTCRLDENGNYYGTYLVPLPDEPDLTHAVTCIDDPDGLTPPRSVPVPDGDWAVLRADLAANTHLYPEDDYPHPNLDCGRQRILQVANSYGELLRIRIDCDGTGDGTVEQRVRRKIHTVVWQPSPASRKILTNSGGP